MRSDDNSDFKEKKMVDWEKLGLFWLKVDEGGMTLGNFGIKSLRKEGNWNFWRMGDREEEKLGEGRNKYGFFEK